VARIKELMSAVPDSPVKGDELDVLATLYRWIPASSHL